MIVKKIYEIQFCFLLSDDLLQKLFHLKIIQSVIKNFYNIYFVFYYLFDIKAFPRRYFCLLKKNVQLNIIFVLYSLQCLMFILIILHNLVLALKKKKTASNLFDIFFFLFLMPENPPKNINKKKKKKRV